MKRALAIGALLGLALAHVQSAEARPPSELPLFLKLNGEATRWTLADGGQSGLYGSSATCLVLADLEHGAIYKVTPSAKIHLCIRSTDAGCNSTATDINYGDPVAADTPHYFILRDNETGLATLNVCMVPASGSANAPIFKMR